MDLLRGGLAPQLPLSPSHTYNGVPRSLESLGSGLRLHKAVDFVVCLGGDGVLLHASSLFKRAIPPVISFNLGSLGFLTNHSFTDFRRDLHDVIRGYEDLAECSLPGEVMRVRPTPRSAPMPHPPLWP